jgi:hypothetical protein
MCLPWLGPKLGDREFAVQVRAEIVHDGDGEENIHSELGRRGLASGKRNKGRFEGIGQGK